MGDVIIAPFLLCWVLRPRIEWRGWQLAELAALFVGLTAVGIPVLTGHLVSGSSYTSEYLVFPFIIWAALRFGQRETISTVVLISAMAVWGAIHNIGPFSAGTFKGTITTLIIGNRSVTTSTASETGTMTLSGNAANHLDALGASSASLGVVTIGRTTGGTSVFQSVDVTRPVLSGSWSQIRSPTRTTWTGFQTTGPVFATLCRTSIRRRRAASPRSVSWKFRWMV